jgi:hypothetical protein
MSHVIHINDPSQMESEPLVLYLSPGEKAIFDLKVVNHGEPVNLSLALSGQLEEIMQFSDVDHYLELEKNISGVVKMPYDADPLDGEIIIITDDESFTIPVALIPCVDDIVVIEDESLIEDTLIQDLPNRGAPIKELFTENDPIEEIQEDDIPIEDIPIEDTPIGHEPIRVRQIEDVLIEDVPIENTPTEAVLIEDTQTIDEAQEIEDMEPFGKKFEIPIIPLVIAALIASLILTFSLKAVPEFPGALATAILIVTLIIYGAATLLKA